MRRKYYASHGGLSRPPYGFSQNGPGRYHGVNDDATGRFFQPSSGLMHGPYLHNPRCGPDFQYDQALQDATRTCMPWPEPAQTFRPRERHVSVEINRNGALHLDAERTTMTKKQQMAFVAKHYRPHRRNNRLTLESNRPLPVICARLCPSLQSG